jgi:hypothetical protein
MTSLEWLTRQPFLLLVPIFIAFSIFNGIRTMTFLRRSQRARATVIDVIRRSLDEDENTPYVFSYIDPTTEEEIKTNPISCDCPARFKQGQKADILYDPNNPRTSIRFDNIISLWIMTILPALASLWVLVMFLMGTPPFSPK